MKQLLTKVFTLPANNRVFGLDFLRAVAILGVIFTHGNLFFSMEQHGWFNSLMYLLGGLGVELFFVLSGFLIGSILLSLESKFSQIRTIPHFWLRRWFRILPNYWFFLSLYIIASVVASNPIPNIFTYLTFTQNWLWPHPYFFGQAWSLAVEEWFYLLFPILVFIFFRLTKSFDIGFIISAFIFIIFPITLRLYWAYTGNEDWDETFRKIMFIRLDAIMYGVLAAWVKHKKLDYWKKYRFHFLGMGILLLIGIVLIIPTLDLTTSFFARTFLFLLVSLSFVLIIPACDQWVSQLNNIFTTSVRLIALWSYSLYLCNLLSALVLLKIMEILGTTSMLISIIFYLLFFMIVFGISSITYTFIEKPAMDLRERLPNI